MIKWIKPEYCTYKRVDCDQCENLKTGICSLTEGQLQILEDEMERRKNAE